MSIKIVLDNYSNKCFSGETIVGNLECNFKNKHKFKAIKIKFSGIAKTKWNEKNVYVNPANNKSTSNNDLQFAEETYILTEYDLVEGTDGNLTVPAGQHFYPFSYTLPAELPSSFEGSVGKIQYYIEAVIERSWKMNYKSKLDLNVVLPLDLNLIPGLRDPVALSDDKIITTRTCCCRNIGAITFKISVPCTGYVPGQEINIKTYIQNTTKINTKSVKFKVVADYEYITHYPNTISKVDSVVIVKSSEGSVGARGQKSWISTLLLPIDYLYPNLTTCKIMKVRYTVKAELVLPKPNDNMTLEFPITIGSVPLSDGKTTIPDPSSLVDPTLPQIALLDNPNAPYPEVYTNIAPPPYSVGSGEPHTFGGSALPPGFIHSHPLNEKLGATPYPPSANASAPYPLHPEESTPYFPSVGGSGAYPPLPEKSALHLPSTEAAASPESVPYPSAPGGSAPYPSSSAESVQYSQSADASAPYPTPPAESAPYPLFPAGTAAYPILPKETTPYPSAASGSTIYPTLSTQSAPYPSSISKSTPNPTPLAESSAGGSAPYPKLSAESAPYPTSDNKTTLYPPVESTSYPPLIKESDPYFPERKKSEPNSKDTTFSEPPPSYEQ